MKDKKYIIITKDLYDNLLDFLDEIQFDIAGNNDKESMHKVNFISWAINELMNSHQAFFPKQKKSREDYVDETFMDWNLPEMSDEDYNKLVDQVDNFLKGWEKEYNKKSKKKSTKEPKSDSKLKPQSKEKFVPPLNDIAEYMSLEEIKEYLLEDDDLADEERFDLYYEEHRRVQDEKNSMSYEELLRKSGLKPPIKN
jgi:hypothetical protein